MWCSGKWAGPSAGRCRAYSPRAGIVFQYAPYSTFLLFGRRLQGGLASAVFFHDGLHLGPVSLHIRHQLELRSAPLQVMRGVRHAEIGVALQIIRQKRMPHSSVISLAPQGRYSFSFGVSALPAASR